VTRRERIAAGLRTARARFRALDRRDRVSLIAFVAIALPLAISGIGALDRVHPTEAVIPGSGSAKAEELGERAFGREHHLIVLLRGRPEALDREGPAIAESIARLPDHRVLDPWRAGGPALRPKQSQAVLVVAVDQSFDDAVKSAPHLRALLRRAVRPPLSAHMLGFADINHAVLEQSKAGMERAELLAVPILVIIVILILGSPIAAAMPLFLGGCVAGAGVGLVDLINRFVTPLEATSVVLCTTMALALGVDYSLLLVARFRRELAAGASVREASSIASARAGRTVKSAGAVLGLAMLAALVTTPADVMKSATVGVLVAMVLSLIGAIVALPPLLRWAGHDINRYQLVSPSAESGRWGRFALTVLRRPAIAAIVVLAALLALSVPALGLETGPPDPRMLPKSSPTRADFDVIEREYGASRSVPFFVTVVAKRGTLADGRLNELVRFERELVRDPESTQVLGPATVASRTAALASAPSALRRAGAELRDGRSGAARLEEGLRQAADGAGELAPGVSAAAAGAAELNAGNAAAQRGATQLDAGVDAIRAGAAALRGGVALQLDGARALHRGSVVAGDGAKTIAEKLALVEREMRAAEPGVTELATGIEQGADGLRRLVEPADLADEKASEALEALEDMLPTSKADPSYLRAYTAVATVVGALSGRDPQTGQPVREGYRGLPASLRQLASQASEAAAGTRELRDSIARLTSGIDQLGTGAVALADGLEALSAGNGQLAGGTARLFAGAMRLEDGLGQLSGGTGQLENGIGELGAGSGQLAEALSAGAGELPVLVTGLDALHAGSRSFQARIGTLANDMDDTRALALLLGSGYAKIAAIATAPTSQRRAAAWAINWDRGGGAVRYLVAQRASYQSGASVQGLPTRADNPFRDRLEKRAHELAGRTGATARVGGPAAKLEDFDEAAQDSLPWLVIVVVLVIYLAFVPILRSLILPFIAVMLNVVTLVASFGVLAIAYGPPRLLGGPGYVDDIMVMVVFTVAFAASIDYTIFILDRMREGYDRTRSVDGAIAYGIEGTAGVLTGAAMILVGVFLVLMTSPLESLRQLGLGVSVALILDATAIRLVLLPAAVRLAGERAWHTPRWLGWTSRSSPG
jgi:RND superfamily putative drug exporter